MQLKIQENNNYGFPIYIWNPVHENKKQLPNFGIEKIVLVESSIDIWSKKIKSELINQILIHCNKYPENIYIFKTRNPERYFNFLEKLPSKNFLSAIIETNRYMPEIMELPEPFIRLKYIHDLKQLGYNTIINIDPIMDFNLDIFYYMLITANPDFVLIDTDIENDKIPKPEKNKVLKLKHMLVEFGLNVRIDINIWRLK